MEGAPGWQDGICTRNLNFVALISEAAADGMDVSVDNVRVVDEGKRRALDKICKIMHAYDINLNDIDIHQGEWGADPEVPLGHSSATITPQSEGLTARRQLWHEVAAEAVCKAFDVQFYTEPSNKDGSYWTFHGGVEDTAMAASAFKMLHNQIEAWALEKKWQLNGPFAHSSYCAGVAKRVLHDITFGTSEDSSQPRESYEIPLGPSGLGAAAASDGIDVKQEPGEFEIPQGVIINLGSYDNGWNDGRRIQLKQRKIDSQDEEEEIRSPNNILQSQNSQTAGATYDSDSVEEHTNFVPVSKPTSYSKRINDPALKVTKEYEKRISLTECKQIRRWRDESRKDRAAWLAYIKVHKTCTKCQRKGTTCLWNGNKFLRCTVCATGKKGCSRTADYTYRWISLASNMKINEVKARLKYADRKIKKHTSERRAIEDDDDALGDSCST